MAGRNISKMKTETIERDSFEVRTDLTVQDGILMCGCGEPITRLWCDTDAMWKLYAEAQEVEGGEPYQRAYWDGSGDAWGETFAWCKGCKHDGKLPEGYEPEYM